MKVIMQYDDGHCVVQDENGQWQPGSFEDRETAKLAQDMPTEQLVKLQNAANARVGGVGGTITREDVLAAQRKPQGRGRDLRRWDLRLRAPSSTTWQMVAIGEGLSVVLFSPDQLHFFEAIPFAILAALFAIVAAIRERP